MHELSISDLPPKKNVLQISEVVSFISEKLTQAQNVLKAKVQYSGHHFHSFQLLTVFRFTDCGIIRGRQQITKYC